MSQRWPERMIPSVTNRFIESHPRLILLALSLLAFAPSICNQFALDDFVNVVDNPSLRSWSACKLAIWAPSFPGNLWRPLTLAINALLVAYFDLNPLPHHLLNLILHCTVTLLLYEAACSKLSRTIALISVGWWSILPIHAEVVANVTGRAELLAATCGLGAVTIALLSEGAPSTVCRRIVHLTLIALLLLCSSLAKESGIVWIVPTIVASQGARLRHACASGFALLTYFLLRWSVLGSHLASNTTTTSIDNPLIDVSAAERIAWGISLLGRYIFSAIVPINLSADYSYGAILPSTFPLQPWTYLAILLIFFASVATNKTARWGFLWFLFAFIPTSNIIIPIGTIFGERLAYAPSIGVIIALVVRLNLRTISLLLAPAALLYISCTWYYCLAWRDNTTLFRHQYSVSPASAKTRLNYGIVLRNEDRTEESTTILREVYDTVPNFPEAALAIATVYIKKGITTGAEHWLNEALALNPDLVPALESLGRLYANRGEKGQAVTLFNKALAIDPRNVRAKIGLYAISISDRDTARTKQLEEELALTASDNAEFLELRKQTMDSR